MTSDETYILGRDLGASIRLDSQHFLFKTHNSHCLHPSITIHDEMRIAELGTGTGIWLLDVATTLPKTARLHGFDISSGLFPHESFLADNVTLKVMDAFEKVPDELAGTYDVVHLRLWCCIVTENDPSRLIDHAIKLLKPGGYLQWEEADLGNLITQGENSAKFLKVAESIFNKFKFNFEWITDLPGILRKQGLEILDTRSEPFEQFLIPSVTKTYLFGYTELLSGVRKLGMMNTSEQTEAERLWGSVSSAVMEGERFHWSPVSVLARKPAIFDRL